MSLEFRWRRWVFRGAPSPDITRYWWLYAFVLPAAAAAVWGWWYLSDTPGPFPVNVPALSFGLLWGFPVFFGGLSLGLAARTRGIPPRYLGSITVVALAQIPVLVGFFTLWQQPPWGLPSASVSTWVGIGFLMGMTSASALIGVFLRRSRTPGGPLVTTDA